MYRKLFAALVLLFFCVANIQSAESDYHLFVSNENNFSVQYPKSWNRASVIHPQTVIRVESPVGDDFNVTAVKNLDLQDMTPDEYATLMHDNAEALVTNLLAQQYPDAKLINKGKTTLSQQPAMYYVADFTLSAAGTKITLRTLAITTKYRDKQYTLTFRTPVQFFPEYEPVIQFIALSFQLNKFGVN